MPKTGEDGHAKKSELPATLARSDQKAQDTFAKTYDSALEQYHEEGRASRTAYSALKHTHEKVGDHWEPKDEPGPSDQRAEQGGPGDEPTAGGVDANATKEHLYEVAQRLGIEGRSSMDKEDLVAAIQRENDRRTRKSRES
jgi:hypothetical protein